MKAQGYDFTEYVRKPRIAANEQLLSDLKYLLHEMDVSFPQVNHAYRKFGVDLWAQAEKLADKIADSQAALNNHEFFDLLGEYIFTPGLQRAGCRSWVPMASNVGTLTRIFYLEFFLRTYEAEEGSYFNLVHQMLKKPATVKFYTGLETTDGFENEILRLAKEEHTSFRDNTPQGELPDVVTDILVEGKVAKVSVDWMGPNMLQNPDFYNAMEERLFGFYDSIANFEHLIFDIRGNVGGYTPFVNRMLIGPHLSEPVELTGFVFFPGEAAGEVVRRCTNTFYPHDIYPRMDIGSMIDKGMLPYLDMNDAKILDSGAKNHWLTFTPTERRSPFKGQIWILIDDNTGSASECFAILARQAGLARIVGEQSRGNYAKTRGQGSLYFLGLPNTGIVVTWDPVYFTDAQGRYVHEHYVIPDYFNHPGKDALETVLEIIGK